MTPSPRAARSLDEALGLALEDLEAGLTPLEVLKRYPQYEAELAPLVETAYRLRTTRWPVLSMSARVAGRERMHAALAEQKVRRHFYVAPLWRQLGAGLALVVLAGTTYLASPVSPLRSMSRPGLTPTAFVAPTVTSTPTASPTAKVPEAPVVIETATTSPTFSVRRTSEATEAADRLKDATRTSLATATFTPTATRTRRPLATSTITTTPAPPPATPVEATVAAPQQPAPTWTSHPVKPPDSPVVEPTAGATKPHRPPKTPAASPTPERAGITGMSASVNATTKVNLGPQMKALGGEGRSAQQERRDVQQAWRDARSSSGQGGRK